MRSQTFQNPIIPGFAPDPSCILVGNTYYLVNSSFFVFPALPIYASKDLRPWTHIGNAINDPNHLSLSNASVDKFPIGSGKMLAAAQGLLAPSIRYHKGKFYVVCTNSTSNGADLTTRNFFVSTADIYSGKWSAPIWYDFQGIDPSIFVDDDDRVYIHGSYRAGPVWDPQCTIRGFEIDLRTGTPLSEIREIWNGAMGKGDAEGPHVYKKDGFYYVLAAEAGTFEQHAITMARSRHIWGPYENAPSNPILTANRTSGVVQHTGHGDLFQGKDGQWWCVCLGVRKVDSRSPLGRETFLTPVQWSEGGFPTIEQPLLEFQRQCDECSTDATSSEQIASKASGQLYLREMISVAFRTEDDTILIAPGSSKLSDPIGPVSFIGYRQRAIVSSASVDLNVASVVAAGPGKAGLSLFKDAIRFVTIGFDSVSNEVMVESNTMSHGLEIKARRALAPDRQILRLKISATLQTYELSFLAPSQDSNWQSLAKIDTNDIATYDFTGPLFGIFATSSSGLNKSVVFSGFRTEA